jgi:hypothetical protein
LGDQALARPPFKIPASNKQTRIDFIEAPL